MADRLYVTHVKSNVKGGVDYDIGPKTVVIGPNESGKSAITNSIELALAGFASRIAGRDKVSADLELLALAPPEEGLFSEVTLSDGSKASCIIERNAKGGAKKKQRDGVTRFGATDDERSRIFPLRHAESAIVGAPATARKFLIDYAVGKVTDEDVLERIPAALRDRYKTQLIAFDAKTPALDKLVGVLESSAAEQRAANARAKAADEIVEQTAQNLGPRPTEADIEAAKAKFKATADALEANGANLALVEAAKQAKMTQGSHQAHLNGIRTRYDETVKRISALQAQLQDVYAQASGLPATARNEVDPNLRALHDVMQWNAEASATQCMVCGSEVKPGLLADRTNQINANIGDALKANQTYQQLDKQARSLQNEIERLAKDVSTMQRQYAEAEAEIAKAAEIIVKGESVAGINVDEIRGAHENAAVLLRQIHLNEGAWKSVDTARSNKTGAEEEALAWKQLNAACGTAIEELLDANVSSFVEKVQTRLAPTDRFFLRLRDGTRPCVRVGLEQANPHSALSESTWARVTAALADVCSDAPGGLSILIPDDRDFDENQRTRLLESLSNCDSQVIVTFANWPKKIPEGWTLIDLTGNLAASPKPAATPRKVAGAKPAAKRVAARKRG